MYHLSAKNICSVPLEWTCSEVEKLEGEVSFLRAKFSIPRSNGLFSRSDSCQNRAKRDFGSPDREKKTIWSRKWKFWLEERKKPKSFTTEEASLFQRLRYIFLCCLHAMTLPHDLELSLGPRNHGNRGCPSIWSWWNILLLPNWTLRIVPNCTFGYPGVPIPEIMDPPVSKSSPENCRGFAPAIFP